MISRHNKTGLTLTELVVASVLIGIVMLGIASFDYAIKNIQDSTNRSAVLGMQAQPAMYEIVKAARTSTGYNGDSGILCNPPTGGANSCGNNPNGVP